MTGRALTNGEIALARTLFGDEIDYQKVRVYFRPWLYAWPRQNISMAPDGNIYFSPRLVRHADMTATPATRAHFIHEMTHVWQYQNGVNIKREAVKLMLRHKFNYNAAYDYDLDKTTDFKKLNIEQQARLLEDYYRCSDNLKNAPLSWKPQINAKMDRCEELIAGHIPKRLPRP